MKRTLLHIAVWALAAVHLSLAAGLQVLHVERVLVPGSGRAVLAQHTCGATERHIPFDHLHQCLACVVQAQQAGLPGSPSSDFQKTVVAGVSLAAAVVIPVPSAFHHTGLRGPPPA
jgi:hypothetical protein